MRKPPAHGNRRRYQAGCRCADCVAWTEAARIAARARRAAGLNRTVKNPKHGTERRADTGCSCAPCEAAITRRRARDNRAKKAKPEKIRRYRRTWNERHPEQARAIAKARRQKHQTHHAPISHVWPFGASDRTTAAINAAIPRSLPEHIRQDVAQELAITFITEGQINPAHVAAAIRAYWRQYPLMSGRERSLDAPARRDGDTRERMIDRLAARPQEAA